MRHNKKHNATTARNLYLKKSIAGTRRRAKFAGILYLLGIIALTAVACLPLMAHENALIGVTEFYKGFMDLDLKSNAGIAKLANSVLYTILLIVVVVNLIKAFNKLGWLCKKTGTKEYGFNRNVYAMSDMGAYFSSDFACILMIYVLIGVFCGGFVDLINMMMLIAVAVGVVIHLLAGFIGAKARYYDLENGRIVEQKRLVGRFACLMRNVLQIAVIAGIVYFLDFAWLNEKLFVLFNNGDFANGISALTGDMGTLIVFATLMVAIVCLFVLIKHATATTEYSMEGIYGSGMKNFRVFAFILFLVAAVATAMIMVMKVEGIEQNNVIFVTVIAFAAFIIEVLLRKYPRLPEDIEDAKWNKQSAYDENEFTFEALARMEQTLDVNNHKDRRPTSII